MYKTIEIRFSTSHAFPVWLQLVYKIVENKVREIGEYSPIKCPVTRENIKSNYNYLSRVVERKSKHCGSSKGIAIIEKKSQFRTYFVQGTILKPVYTASNLILTITL